MIKARDLSTRIVAAAQRTREARRALDNAEAAARAAREEYQAAVAAYDAVVAGTDTPGPERTR